MTLPPKVEALFSRIDAMSLRERAMLAATVFAVLWALWDAALMKPLEALERARQDQVDTTATQLQQLNTSIRTLAEQRGEDPDGEARRRIAELAELALELDGELRAATGGLVAPAEMASLLESVLGEVGALELVGMQTLPGEPVLADDGETGYYRHGIAVDVRGAYLDALRYARTLEALRWQFFWDSIEIEVKEHPTADIRIVVYTLSRQKGVLGV